uniref:DNA (cytosine-5-)-methyltransferase n=2 Tax=Lotharella globosa TaxID=91324 RepID=A0A6V3MSV9_9EUKA
MGGMASALNQAKSLYRVAEAYDMNLNANLAYELNFHIRPSCSSIENLKKRQLDKKARFWLLSPPCQPYTRAGKQEDINDPRSRSFLNLLEVLVTLDTPPDYFLMENVKGFDTSKMREFMLTKLRSLSFHIAEFLLQPKQFGIPNTRLRYYCIARRTKPFPGEVTSQINLSIPSMGSSTGQGMADSKATVQPPTLGEFLGKVLLKDDGKTDIESFLVPQRVLKRCGGYRFDIAAPWSRSPKLLCCAAVRQLSFSFVIGREDGFLWSGMLVWYTL